MAQGMEAVYGINPIKSLLSRQETPLKRIIIADGRSGPAIREIIDRARQRKISVEWKPRQRLDELAGSQDHQGIVGLRDFFAYADLDDVLKNRRPQLSN